jgi:predicted dehydrogenase
MYQREYAKKIRVGLVGVGSHTYRNLLPALHHLPVTLAAMCNRGVEKLARTAEEFPCPIYPTAAQMYANTPLDAVIISVSPQQHPDLVSEALQHGMHVFVEKPPAMRAADVQRMIDQRGDRVVVVGYKKIFMPAAEKAYEVIQSARYGNLNSILAMYPMSIPGNGVEVLAQGTFTNWLANGCHPISLMLAAGGKVRSVITQTNERGFGTVAVNFDSGAIGCLHLASGPQPIEAYHFYGERWHLSIENADRITLQRGIPFDYAKTWNFAPPGDDSGAIVWEPQNSLATLENKSLFVQGIVQEMQHFCTSILEKRPASKGTLEFAYAVMQVYEAALLSHGTMVAL